MMVAWKIWSSKPDSSQTSKKRESLSQIYRTLTPNRQGPLSQVKPSPSSLPEAAYSRENFLEILRKDRFCDLLAIGDAPIQDEIEALLAQPSTQLDSQAELELKYLFLGERAPMFGKPNLKESSQILDFFNALVLSGLLMGSGSTELNEQNSLELFYNLINGDGENAAFPFFQTAALKKFGADQGQLRAAFLRAFRADHFDAFYNRISSQLADKSYSSPTAMLVFVSVSAQIPVPDFTAVTRFLYPMIDEESNEFAQGALHLGQVLMRAGDFAKQSSNGPLFGALEYASGRGIYLRALKKLHAEPDKDLEIPATAQWMKQGRSEANTLGNPILEYVQKPRASCDRVEADEIFEKVKRSYLSRK